MSTNTAASSAEGPSVAEDLVVALTATWQAIREQNPQVPAATLDVREVGWLGQDVWVGHRVLGDWQGVVDDRAAGVGKLVVTPQALRMDTDRLLVQLLHQAAHGLAELRGVADTSRRARQGYHNATFKDLAEELGLVVAEAGNSGWAATGLPDQVAERYADVLEQLAAAVAAYPTEPRPRERPKAWHLLVARCQCARPRPIRVAKATLKLAPIVCGACGAAFTADHDTAE